MNNCKSCRWFLVVEAEKDAETGKPVGRCKRHAPQLITVASMTKPDSAIKFRENGQMQREIGGLTTHYLNGSGWPTVREDEWCGDFAWSLTEVAAQ